MISDVAGGSVQLKENRYLSERTSLKEDLQSRNLGRAYEDPFLIIYTKGRYIKPCELSQNNLGIDFADFLEAFLYCENYGTYNLTYTTEFPLCRCEKWITYSL